MVRLSRILYSVRVHNIMYLCLRSLPQCFNGSSLNFHNAFVLLKRMFETPRRRESVSHTHPLNHVLLSYFNYNN